MKTVGIVSLLDDMHAKAIANIIQNRGGSVSLIYSNLLAEHNSRIGVQSSGIFANIRDSDGRWIDPVSISSVWWRRSGRNQINISDEADVNYRTLIDYSFSYYISGLFLNSFQGNWFNEPMTAIFSESKINQICSAKKCGAIVPETMFSNDIKSLKEFIKNYKGEKIVVKSLYSDSKLEIKTVLLEGKHLDAESISLCPSIFQIFVDGDRHVRIVSFDQHCIAIMLHNSDVDSRLNLTGKAEVISVDSDVYNQITRIKKCLGIRFGVFDYKCDKNGKYVFLEVNQQGQFLYLDAMTNAGISTKFAEHLIELAG